MISIYSAFYPSKYCEGTVQNQNDLDELLDRVKLASTCLFKAVLYLKSEKYRELDPYVADKQCQVHAIRLLQELVSDDLLLDMQRVMDIRETFDRTFKKVSNKVQVPSETITVNQFIKKHQLGIETGNRLAYFARCCFLQGLLEVSKGGVPKTNIGNAKVKFSVKRLSDQSMMETVRYVRQEVSRESIPFVHALADRMLGISENLKRDTRCFKVMETDLMTTRPFYNIQVVLRNLKGEVIAFQELGKAKAFAFYRIGGGRIQDFADKICLVVQIHLLKDLDTFLEHIDHEGVEDSLLIAAANVPEETLFVEDPRVLDYRKRTIPFNVFHIYTAAIKEVL